METQDRPLRHDPKLGEVDPRTYPLICWAKFACPKVGSHDRILQVSRLQRTLDKLCTENGDSKTRIHFTVDPEIDSKIKVEVRLQPLTLETDKIQGFVGMIKQKLSAMDKSKDYDLTFQG